MVWWKNTKLGEDMLTKKQKKLPMALQKAIMKKQKKSKKAKRRK